MSRIAYVNGRYVRHALACVHIEDRGYQFADGVYEVWAASAGRLIDADGHFDRLQRSLCELAITPPMGRPALERVLRETLRRNRVRDGAVYLQITRGVAPRDHGFPPPDTPPGVVATAKRMNFEALSARAAEGVAVATQPDQRWARCDIKTVSLLPNVLAKQAARAAGAYEAWMVDAEGLVTEGASTNAWIVDAAGVLRTRDTDANILRGVTRRAVLEMAHELQVTVEERPFAIEEVIAAREAFITSASAFVTPVIAIDGHTIGSGRPGPLARRLRALYLERAGDQTSLPQAPA